MKIRAFNLERNGAVMTGSNLQVAAAVQKKLRRNELESVHMRTADLDYEQNLQGLTFARTTKYTLATES